MGIVSSKLSQYAPTISVMAVVSFVYYYIFHGFPGSNSAGSYRGRKKSGIIGLKNFGNTCYFNSCIQAMAACNLFCAWIERRNLLNATNKVRKQDDKNEVDDNGNDLRTNTSTAHLPFPVISALHQAFTLINAKSDVREPCLSELIPSNLIRELTAHNLKAVKSKRMGRFILNSDQEQDTHEAFNFILGTIADESSNISKVYHSSTAMALSQDAVCLGEENEDDGETQSLSFCKLTKKSVSNPSIVAADRVVPEQADGEGIPTDEADYEEEDERLSSTSAFCKLGHSSTVIAGDDQKETKSSGGGDVLPSAGEQVRGKRSKKEWFGGSIVSRTQVHELEVIQDTVMTQHVTFDGTLGVKLVCLACNRQNPPALDKFNTLTVTIPRDPYFSRPMTLEDLLLHSLKPIQVHGVNCDGCLNKFGKVVMSSFVKYTAIARMPLTLCIHINRSEWTNDGVCIKRNEYVRFPVYLDLGKFKRISDLMNQSPSQYGLPSYGELSKVVDSKTKETRIGNTQYVLKAVICHSGGSADTGHFTTYRQSHGIQSIGEGWYFISDCQINSVTLSEVLSSAAYMLFYEKRTMLRI